MLGNALSNDQLKGEKLSRLWGLPIIANDAVSKEIFGRQSSMLAAACLIVDYIMTVAASISSSTAAVISAQYRDVLQQLDQYILDREAKLKKGQHLTVLVPYLYS